MREGLGIDPKKFDAEYERIFGERDPLDVQKRAGHTKLVASCGQFRSDTKGQRSFNGGVAPHQIEAALKAYGGTGVKFCPKTGDAIYKNSGVRRRYVAARGMIDRGDIQGGPSRPGEGVYGKVAEQLNLT